MNKYNFDFQCQICGKFFEAQEIIDAHSLDIQDENKMFWSHPVISGNAYCSKNLCKSKDSKEFANEYMFVKKNGIQIRTSEESITKSSGALKKHKDQLAQNNAKEFKDTHYEGLGAQERSHYDKRWKDKGWKV